MVRPTKGTIQKRNAAAAGRAVIEAQKARMAALNEMLARDVPAENGYPVIRHCSRFASKSGPFSASSWRLVSSLAHEGLHILEFQQGRQWPRAGTSTKHDHGPFFRTKCAELIEISGGLIQPECKEFDHL
ncbi:hypothetical protein niasHT_006389 [Heterodera trifolii]|uniref:Uncharacterized protein n=1 Tax=Heterodera trifolii TaxID=157864 RepID=A0ABD2M3H2_9BILA